MFLKKKKFKLKKIQQITLLKTNFIFFNLKNIYFFKLKSSFNSVVMPNKILLFFLKLNFFKMSSFLALIKNVNYFLKLKLLKVSNKFVSLKKIKKKKIAKFKLKKNILKLKNVRILGSNKFIYTLKKYTSSFVLKNWYIMKFFYFIIKYTLLFFFDKIFFKLKIFQIFLAVKNIKYFFLSNLKLKKKLFYLNKQVLPLFFYKKNFFYFSIILTYSLLNHSLTLILETLEKFLRRILGKRHFITHFLNTLRFFKKITYLLAYCFLLRGTIEKHGRTLTFFLLKGKLSLQTFTNIIYYDYIQCYQKYGVFGLHLWIRYQTNIQRLNI